MRVLIAVYFRAPMGGLQEHVRYQALGLNERGFECLVACPPGPFSDSLESDGVAVFRTDFVEVQAEVARVLDTFVPDLVHVHPFASRMFGIQVAKRVGCPVISTFHGLYTDGVGGWADDVVQIISVSEGVKRFVTDAFPQVWEKMIVIPNGVVLPTRADRDYAGTQGVLKVLVAGRFDDDTSVFVRMLTETWTRQLASSDYRIRWHVAGSGARLDDLHELSHRLAHAAGEEIVTMHGWVGREMLSSLEQRVDIAVSPGRSALESMAAGVPTIAVGSRAYYGPTWRSDSDGMGWNWGFSHAGGYESDSLYRDLVQTMKLSVQQREAIGRASRELVAAFYSQKSVDDRLAAVYRMHLAAVT